MDNKIYIIGHKSPDLDSVAAAISYADYKNKNEKTDIYIPAIAGEANKETKEILAQTAIPMPEKLETLEDKQVILVDHNEASQSEIGVNEAKILGILDHHKLDFKYSEPIEVCIKPWGSSCSIVFDKYKQAGIEIEENLAKLMLAAVLVDTVITKSPTCTEIDKHIIDQLAQIAKVDSFEEFGMEIFKVRSDISDLSNEEIIKSDYKEFEMSTGTFGIGQVETADLTAFEDREADLIEDLRNIKEADGLHSIVLFLTDIINVGSKFLVVTSDQESMEEALTKKLESNQTYLEGIISRKKQVVPMITKIFDK